MAMYFCSSPTSVCCMNVLLSTHTEVFSMDFINRNHSERKEINPKIFLQKSIILLLSHWYALQMAVENQWGGYDSLQKSHQLAADLFSWLFKSNGCRLIFQFIFSRFLSIPWLVDSFSHILFSNFLGCSNLSPMSFF